MTDEGVVQPSFPFWKARFGAECVAGVVQGTLTSRAPKYSIILELDRKVRDMELPAYAQGAPPQGAGLAQTMSHFMPTNYRELSESRFHYLSNFVSGIRFFRNYHRPAQITAKPLQYAPSFLAGYRSACTIIGSVRQQFGMFPAQIARFWVLWTHAFSASVMLASVVTHSSSKVAPAALLELNTVCELFQQASAYGGRAAKFLPILRRLQSKAQKTFLDTTSGIPPSVMGDIFVPTPAGGQHKDELSIFSGKTHTVTTKAAPRMHTSTATSSSSGSPRSASDSPNAPSQAFIPVDNPSFAGVHPSLVMELRGFDGQIAAQIREAYGTNGVGVAARTEGPVLESTSRQQIQMAHKEYAERIEIERQNAERQQMEKQQLEKQQLEMEQQRLYHEQEQEQLRLQEQEQYQQQQVLQEQQRVQQLQHQQKNDRQVQHHRPQYQQPPQQYAHYNQNAIRQAPGFTDPHQLPSHSRSGSGQRHIYIHSERDTQQQLSPPQQRSMYAASSEYRETVPPQPGMANSQYTTSEQAYTSSAHLHKQQLPIDHHVVAVAQPASSSYSQDQYTGHPYTSMEQQSQPPQQEAYQYWTQHNPAYMSMNQVVQNPPPAQLPQHQHYTPDGALRGIAADDRSLQETWQSYMYKVGSPRHLFED
ncbi:hypothetical protein H0H87_002133 [Tephrocybe sp. NHM501043]|nr:hypothetical protein H0H87_002133 [Tephrocybe sp. NHM501043]